MAEYKTKQINYFNEIDEIGSKYSLVRLENETVESFQDRVMYQCRASHTAKIEDIGAYINNCLGLLEEPMLELNRVLDSSGEELYPRSYIEIDSNYISIIKDVFSEEVILLKYREYSDFSDIKDAINATGVFNCSAVDNVDINEFNTAFKLKCEKNLHYDIFNFTETKSSELNREHIVDFELNLNEKAYNLVDSFEDIKAEGDYYIDVKKGKVVFFEEVTGSVSYSYAEFPFFLKKQNIKISSCKDESFNHLIKEEVIEEGNTKRIKVNERGAEFYNDLFKSFSNHWDA